MRRMYIIFTCCVVLLFVPIYLWQVKGWDVSNWFCPKQSDTIATAPPDIKDIQVGAAFDRPLIEQLAKTNPVELLKRSLAHYRDNIHGYTCVLAKQERVQGKLASREVIQCSFREEPFSVLMVWKEGKGQAAASLYRVAINREKMFIRPSGAIAKRIVAIAERAPDCTEAQATNRFLINEFGLRKGTERTYTAWKEIKERGLMHFEYRGIQKCEQAGNCDCHVITRHCDPSTEKGREHDEGLTEITIFVDVESGLQVGSILKAKNELIAEYYFADIHINPTFDPAIFTKENLKKY